MRPDSWQGIGRRGFIGHEPPRIFAQQQELGALASHATFPTPEARRRTMSDAAPVRTGNGL
jgi:hypothetical protein